MKAYPRIRLFFPVESCEIMACSIVASPGRIVRMDTATEPLDALLRSGARRLTGYPTPRCSRPRWPRNSATAAPAGRTTLRLGTRDGRARDCTRLSSGMRCLEDFAARGRRRSEDKDPRLAADIRAIVEPHSYADPELKSSRRYTNLSARRGARGLDRQGAFRGRSCPASGRCATSSIA